jgi:queuine tRNA-ribosyltransferase
MFKITSEQGKARTGILSTKHGKIETPFFMPVATKMTAKLVSPDELEDSGVKAIIANSFLIHLDPGLEFIEKIGIHRFMNFNNVIFTDSGGFQMISRGFLVKSSDDGVTLKSPYDGVKHLLTPELAMSIQEKIQSDAAMCLDDLRFHGTCYKDVAESVKRTHDWAERCRKAHKDKKQLLFGIVQGSVFDDLRKESCRYISSLDFDGIALGGLAIGETKEQMHSIIGKCTDILPIEKPKYVMGLGTPQDLLDAIGQGIDIFDSCYPTRVARRGTAFSSNGRISIERRIYRHDLSPLDRNCDCIACQKYSKAYIHHLVRIKEPLGMKLVTLHNIRFVQKLLEDARQSIREGGFEKFRKQKAFNT